MNFLRKLAALSMFALLIRCAFNSEIRTFQDLSKHNTGGSIQVVTIDTSVYFVDDYFYTDSILSIKGRKNRLGKDTLFEGNLLFKDVAYIQTRETYFFPSLAYLGLNLYICASAASFINKASQVEPVITFARDGSSCPYIYSWDGNDYYLEGEGFGTALGKALEIESSLILRKLDERGSKLNLKISNQRPETHFINNIELYGFELGHEEILYTDNYNKFYSLKDKKEIYNAVDINKQNITELLNYEDNKYWYSDLKTAEPELNFEDQIIVELDNVGKSDSISIIITAINTEIFNVVFEYLQKLLGEDYVNFIRAAETDPELISILESALERSSLKIDIWNGHRWQYADLVYPQANFVSFHKIINIPSFRNNDRKVKVRLRCLTDVWQLDAISFSEKFKREMLTEKIEIVKLESNTKIRQGSIRYDDSLYLKLLPGDHLNLEFNNVISTKGKKRSYGLKIKGYLYEWLIDKGLEESMVKVTHPDSPRVKLVKKMLQDIDLILPLIYSRWSDVKACYALGQTKN